MRRNGGWSYVILVAIIMGAAPLVHMAAAMPVCGDNCGYGPCPTGLVCLYGSTYCNGSPGYTCVQEGGSSTSTTSVHTTTSTSTSVHTTTSTMSVSSTSTSTATTTTIASGGTPTTTSTVVPSGPTLPTTSVPNGAGGHVSTTVSTTIITTTIAQRHGTLILTETGLPSGVIFGAYLQSQPGFIYAVNTSVNDSVVFPDIDIGNQTYEILNVTVMGTVQGTGFLYQTVPPYGSTNIANNQTSSHSVRFVATPITTTLPTTTTIAQSAGGGANGIIQGVVDAIEGFFSYLFGGR